MRHNRILVILVTTLLTIMVFMPSYQAPNTNNPIENRDDCVVLINESFENGFPPENWTNTGWIDSLFGEPYHGDHWAYSWVYGDVLTTPPLEFGVNTTLTFWYRAESSSHPMSLEVHVNDMLVWSDSGFTHDNYEMGTVYLDSFSGFKTISFIDVGGDFYGLCLDMITVTTVPMDVYVDDDADQSWYDATHVKTIQEGINNASSGNTVFVFNSTYYENLVVNKTIDLIGEDKNNTIIDGSGSKDVIYVSSDNVLIRNFKIQGNNIYKSNKGIDCDAGIDIRSNYNTIENNCIVDNYCGIFLYGYNSCNNNRILNNNFSNNTIGLGLASSYNNEVSGNSFLNDGMYVEGTSNNTVHNNTVNGKPLIYMEDASNQITDSNAGQVILIGCDNITVRDSNLSQTTVGIELAQTNNSYIKSNIISDNLMGVFTFFSNENTIIQNNISSNTGGGVTLFSFDHNNTISENDISLNIGYGIYLYASNNTISNNNITFNDGNGVWLDTYCYNNTISENYLDANSQTGIVLKTSSNDNLIEKNTISNNIDGINIESSSNNTIENNKIQLNIDDGIRLSHSTYNTIRLNDIINNQVSGIEISQSTNNNRFYHNNFIDNNPNAFSSDENNNIWDDGYPSGGNFWSDYTGYDMNGDGMGEIPYNVSNENNTDNYPFVQSYGWLIELEVNQSTFDRGFPIRHALDGDWAGAQNFTPTYNTFAYAEIYLRKFGTPEFNLTVELRENHLQGTLIDTLSFTPGEVPSGWEWFQLNFEDTSVEPDTNLFIVIPPAPSGVTTSFGYEWGYAFGDQYADGSFWFTRDGGGLWRDLPIMYEFTFKTYGYD